MNLTLRNKKTHFRENWLLFWGIWGPAELILGFWEQRQNSFREQRNLLSEIPGDRYIISREQGSTALLGASDVVVWEGELIFSEIIPLGSQNYIFCLFDLILYVPVNDF